MRPTKNRRPTHRGLGDPTEDEASLPPPSSRGVVAVPPSEPSVGRYSVRPAASTTREFKSPVGPSMKRRLTDKMPAHVDKKLDDIRPRVLASPEELGRAPLGSREAFVLSLIDGQVSLSSLRDVAGLEDAELTTILDRLVVLKLIALA
jgi:hypothetical protein